MQAAFANAILQSELCRCHSSRMEPPNAQLCIKRWSPNPMQATYAPKLFYLFLQQIFQSCQVPVPETLCFNTSAVMSCRLYLQMPPPTPPPLPLTENWIVQMLAIKNATPQCPNSSSRADLPNPWRQHMPQSCFICFCTRFSKVVWCLFQKPCVLIHLL